MKRYYNRRFPQRRMTTADITSVDDFYVTKNSDKRCLAANGLQPLLTRKAQSPDIGFKYQPELDGNVGSIQQRNVIGELNGRSNRNSKRYNKKPMRAMKQQHPLLLSSILLLMLAIVSVLASRT